MVTALVVVSLIAAVLLVATLVYRSRYHRAVGAITHVIGEYNLQSDHLLRLHMHAALMLAQKDAMRVIGEHPEEPQPAEE